MLFFTILGKMAQRCELERKGYPLSDLAGAVYEAVEEICALVGPVCERDDAPPHENFLSFVLTNGSTMLAHQGGKNLYYSAYKSRCSERESCAHYAPECEGEVKGGFVSHLIFSSEPLQGENVWKPMQPREAIGVDWRMQMQRFGI